MWNVAICDDDPEFCHQLSLILQTISPTALHISVFYSGALLLEDYDRRKCEFFDLIFLDIEMPGINGISTTNEIKQKDQGVIIVIITNYERYALPAFTARAFHYLMKPATIEKVQKIYWEAVDLLTKDKNDILILPWRNEIRQIRITKIYYIESYADLIEIHTAYDTVKAYCPLKRMEGLLKGRPFARVHKSFIVNLAKINFIDKTQYIAVLYDGSQIPISRKVGTLKTMLARMIDLGKAEMLDSTNRRKM